MPLLQDKIILVGTLKKNKKEILAEFLPNKQTKADLFINVWISKACYSRTLVSFTPKKKKSVVLLSTMHRDAKVDAETKKPEII